MPRSATASTNGLRTRQAIAFSTDTKVDTSDDAIDFQEGSRVPSDIRRPLVVEGVNDRHRNLKDCYVPWNISSTTTDSSKRPGH